MKPCSVALIAALGFGSVISTQAQAIAVKWTVETFTLDDGGAVTGSYIYDASTGVFSEISLSTSAGSVMTAGANFTFSGAFGGDNTVDLYETLPSDLMGIRSLYFELNDNMTDLGGTISIYGYDSVNFGRNIVEGICEDATCALYDASAPGRGPVAGSTARVVGVPLAPVPLPAGAPLFLSGFLAFCALKPRREAA